MRNRDKIGALVGTGLLTFAMASTAFAAAPTYSVAVTKTATPDTVVVGGESVLFTVTVENTGTGSFQAVDLVDSLGGCTLSAPSGTGAPTTLASGDTWTYTCTVTGVVPDTTNTVTVNACHNNGGCTNELHDATGTASVTVPLGPGAGVPTPVPSETPVPSATGGGADVTAVPSAPATDTALSNGSSGPADAAWVLIAGLGVLIASAVILTPGRAKRRR
jgi:uncharacterized repeat protein (TIGR01451 family)